MHPRERRQRPASSNHPHQRRPDVQGGLRHTKSMLHVLDDSRRLGLAGCKNDSRSMHCMCALRVPRTPMNRRASNENLRLLVETRCCSRRRRSSAGNNARRHRQPTHNRSETIHPRPQWTRGVCGQESQAVHMQVMSEARRLGAWAGLCASRRAGASSPRLVDVVCLLGSSAFADDAPAPQLPCCCLGRQARLEFQTTLLRSRGFESRRG